MALNFVSAFVGDSRVVGIGDPTTLDYLTIPNFSNFGSGYTSVPTVTLTGGGGSGGAMAGYRDQNPIGTFSGAVTAAPTSRGSGYLGNPPTISITGGGGANAAATATLAGGYMIAVETALKNAGLLTTALNCARSGARITNFIVGSGSYWESIPVAISTAAANQNVVILDVGVNDAIAGSSAGTFQTQLQTFITQQISLGVKAFIIDKPFGVNSGYTNASAVNALVSSYSASIDAIVAANPTTCFAGANLYPVIAAHPEYLAADNLHPNAAGNTALAPIKGAAYTQALIALFGAIPTTVPVAPPQVKLVFPITLSWDSVNGADGYRVYRNGILVQDSTAQTYIDTYAAGKSQTYTLTAYNRFGETAQKPITVSDSGLLYCVPG